MNTVINKIRGKIGLKAECILETDEERQVVWDALNALEKQNKEAEPVHGHWIKNAEWQGWHCSECGQDDVYAFMLNLDGSADALQDYFCPHCGARMEDNE